MRPFYMVLADNRFGKYQHFVAQYFNHTTINGKCLLARGCLNRNRSAGQCTHHGSVVVQYLKLSFATRKRNGRCLSREYFPVRRYDFERHIV